MIKLLVIPSLLLGFVLLSFPGISQERGSRGAMIQAVGEVEKTERIQTTDLRVFSERRARIMEQMQGNVAIFSTDDPDNFFYATGFDQQPAIAVLDPQSDEPFKLFLKEANPTQILWDGPRHTTDDAVRHFGADGAYTLEALDGYLMEILRSNRSVSVLFGDDMVMERMNSRTNRRSNMKVHTDLSEVVHEMRVIKDRSEQKALVKSAEVTVEAHKRVMEIIKPGMFEYQIRSEIEYVFGKSNCKSGFSPIVGSGPNATYLHYPFYDRQLQAGDLILIDIGASCDHYTADVTRTFPVSGRFSPEQRALYELVLQAKEVGLEMMKPGVGILEPHHAAMDVIFDGLYELGLMTDRESWWQQRFYVHYGMLHYIGLYVHDVGHFADFIRSDRDYYLLNKEIKGRTMEAGMVLTLEPGLYFEENRINQLEELLGNWASIEELREFEEAVRPVYEKYAGIGIRIEDDVLITESGSINLSAGAPRTVEEIEAVMGR